MVKAPTIQTPTTTHPQSNATVSADVAQEADVNVAVVVSRTSSSNSLIADNASGGVANNANNSNNANNVDNTAAAADNVGKIFNSGSHSEAEATTAETDECANSSSASTSDAGGGVESVKINGNDTASSPTSEQSTQTDDDDNSSVCSSTNSIRYFAIGQDDNDKDNNNDVNNVNAAGDAEFVVNTRDGEVDDDANDAVDAADDEEDVVEDDDEEETYCVGHFYGQDEDEVVPDKPPDVLEDPPQDPVSTALETVLEEEPAEETVEELAEETVAEPAEVAEVPDHKPLEVEPVPPPTTVVPLPKPFTMPHPIPQIIGIPGMMPPPQQQPLQPPPPAAPQPHQQPAGGGLLQPLHLATLGSHAAGAVNQQISPTAAVTPGASTPIHHHHHCVHHPHVHLHSPGHQPPSAGAAGTSGSAPGAAGHPHTHIFPLQVISLAQPPGTGAAPAGAATAWSLVEAPMYVDANGEYRPYCPAHPQGPPPREHRVLLQLDAGVSLPLQIAGKRKVFRGCGLKEEEEKGKFVAALMGGTFGTVITWPISGVIIESMGWDWAFYMVAIFVGIVTAAWFVIVEDSPSQHKTITPEERELITKSLGDSVSTKKKLPPFKQLASSLPFWSLLLLHYGSMWGLFFLITAAPKFMSEVLGFNLSSAGFLSSLPHLARLLCAFGFGAIADSVRRRDWLSVTKIRKYFCIPSHIIPGLFLVVLAFFGRDPYMCVAIMTLSLGFNGAATVTNLANSQDLAPNYAGTLYGTINFVGTTPGIISLSEIISRDKKYLKGKRNLMFMVLKFEAD